MFVWLLVLKTAARQTIKKRSKTFKTSTKGLFVHSPFNAFDLQRFEAVSARQRSEPNVENTFGKKGKALKTLRRCEKILTAEAARRRSTTPLSVATYRESAATAAGGPSIKTQHNIANQP